MSDQLESRYRRFNTILSVVIGGLLATVAGLFLYQNKDYKFSAFSIGRAEWPKGSFQFDSNFPKADPVKTPDTWQLNKFMEQQTKAMEQMKQFKYQPPPPPQIRVPTFQPPPAFRR